MPKKGHQKIPFQKRLSSNRSLKKGISEAKNIDRYQSISNKKPIISIDLDRSEKNVLLRGAHELKSWYLNVDGREGHMK